MLYLIILSLHLQDGWGRSFILGVYDAEYAIIPTLLVMLFALTCLLPTFEYSRETFYHHNVVFLIRDKSRSKSYLKIVWRNMMCIGGIMIMLQITGLLLDRQVTSRLCSLAIVQLLAVENLVVFQTILEIKWSALGALLVCLLGTLSLQLLHSPVLGLFHTRRLELPGNVAILAELAILAILVGIGCLSIRKQEVY
ncbi:hypothetical protein [Lacticaseibacillus jixiensis]|uniref:hypothetical protein n=1 Tax=Lacticaseibacillus jixiensis TaxID=3231926 RepID=UPI0036F38F8F